MTVCYVTMGFPLDVETFACTDIRMLRAAGVDVMVSTLLAAPPNATQMLQDRGLAGLRVDYASPSAWWRGLRGALLHPRLLLSVLKLIVRHTWNHPRFLLASLALLPRAFDIALRLERLRVDVVHLFWGHYPALVLYLLRRRRPSIVRSMFLGAYDLVYAYGPSRIVACEADVLWTHARENIPTITALGVPPERINVVHRGVDLDVFRPAAKVRHRIVCAARLCHDKHVDDVLRAFAKVRTSWPDASLVILGDGPERSRLQNLSEQLRLGAAVEFRGHVPHHVVRDEMAVAECFTLMSRENTERLTNAIKEAMACKCVVVVTDSPGIDELITDGVDGFVIGHAAVDRAADLVDWAFTNVAGSSAVGQKAVERIQSGFNAARAMTTYRRRWSELVRTSAAQGRATSAPPSVWSPTSTTDMV